jgi:hypothetical protein
MYSLGVSALKDCPQALALTSERTATRHESFVKALPTLDNEQYRRKLVLIRRDNLASHSPNNSVQVLMIDRLFHPHDLVFPSKLSIGTSGTSMQNGGLISPESPDIRPIRNGHLPRPTDPRMVSYVVR